jgi:hypothetical protein
MVTRKIKNWVIQVGGGYGSFLFKGTEEQAEFVRIAKAKLWSAVALKRLADKNEIKTQKASYCWNHKLFPHNKRGIVYFCSCGKCSGDK